MPDEIFRYAMIMAGGAGTRLWPMSRLDRPKQLLPFIGGRSLLALAAERLEGAVAPERRLVCTAERYRAAVREAVPALTDDQILGEPVGRNTVNAIGFTAAVLAKRDPHAVFAVLTSDHVIAPADEFRRSLELAFALVRDDPRRFVTFAITPTFAASQYGWVKRGAPLPGHAGAFLAEGFDEKPPEERARAYLDSGDWGWNSGMFVYHAGHFLRALEQFEPESYEGVRRIGDAWGTPDARATLEAVYPTLPGISVDYSVMEPAAASEAFDICAVPMDVTWLDVGSWPAYGETLPEGDAGCRTNARAHHIDSTNVLAISDDPAHTIATVGCSDLIIVHTADVTMVCPAPEAQRVRELADRADEALRFERRPAAAGHGATIPDMRYLAIDLGDKRTGLAVGDDGTAVVSPLTVLEVPRGEALVAAVLREAAGYEPDALVVGLPLNMDGTEGDRARIAREFARELGARSGLPVHLQDERLTSEAAEAKLAGSGRTHRQKKARRDALAAAEILRDHLETRRR